MKKALSNRNSTHDDSFPVQNSVEPPCVLRAGNHSIDKIPYRENWKTIKDEVEELRKNRTNWFVMDHGDLMSSGGYEEFPLYSYGHRRAYHCSLAPVTCALVGRFRAAARDDITQLSDVARFNTTNLTVKGAMYI